MPDTPYTAYSYLPGGTLPAFDLAAEFGRVPLMPGLPWPPGRPKGPGCCCATAWLSACTTTRSGSRRT